MPKLGERMPYRSLPADFEHVFVTSGWNGAKATFRAHTRVISRFLDESGRERLLKLRREHVATYGRKSVASRYMMGRRLMSLDVGAKGED